MLTTWGRVLTRTAGVSALKPLLAYRTVIPVGHRSLATVTTSKKAAPTATKKTGATKSTTTAKARAPAKKTTTTATNKKAAPKTVAATKKKPATAATKKTASVKAVVAPPKKRVKKTDEEKARERIKSLIERALHPPVIHSANSMWIEFLKQKHAATKNTGAAIDIGKVTSQWAQEYKSLSPAQQEGLRAQAEASKDNGQQVLADWVKQHTPAQIHDANVARSTIRTIKEKAEENSEKAPRGLGGAFPDIPDERYPKQPRTANIFYVMEKFASLPKEKKFESLGGIMKEYTALPEAEKQKWKELAAQDAVRYRNELKSIGIEPRKE